jgi:DNA polymerase delta subunit 3
LERWRVYGSIQNPYIKVDNLGPLPQSKTNVTKRRTAKAAPAVAKAAIKANAKPAAAFRAATEEMKQAPAVAARKENTPDESKSGRSTPQPGPAASLKRSDSKTKAKKDASVGNLFKSFAKAKPKAKEAEKAKDEDGTLSDRQH